ncbi:MAG: lamin tail domain-containing protein, partial [Candidatus Thermoplasmatota archaeon]|nr:lamin tail domain-containing protein [Candidatus Thermoplasmatota archaeon]
MLSGKQSSAITVLVLALLMFGIFANVSWATATIQEEQTQLLINEFMPWPEQGEEEYIELYNPGDSPIFLDGWLIDDMEGGSAPKGLDGMVVPEGGYLVLWGGFTRVRLNNDGDSVRLIDPDGVVVDQHDYRFSDPGVPFSRLPDGGEWFSPPNPTPGASNGPGPADGEYGAKVVMSSFMSGATTDWEFISVENMGPPVDLGGWRISDGEGCWKLPAHILGQGERVVIAANQTLYMMQTGQEADIIPDGRISLGDYGDDIYLFDNWGWLMDVVWYGNMEPEGEGWTGSPAPYPSRGMVAFRNGDTNSSADWCPLKFRVVGATEFHGGVHDVAKASFFVSPDCGYAPILRTLEEAEISLDINLYQLTSQPLADGI